MSIAIDFGTSNTVVAVQKGADQIIWQFPAITREFSTPQGAVAVIPSLGYAQPRRRGWLWGEPVRQLPAETKQSHRYWYGFKRELVADARSPARLIDGEMVDSSLVARRFLEHLLGELRRSQVNTDQVVFTAPVGAFSGYVQWFRKLAEHLQIPQMRIIDEATAAALGYALVQPNSLVMVVDFGGGTLDISIVRTIEIIAEKQALQAEVLAKADAYIGGIDIDQWIAEYWVGKQTTAEILTIAEQVKILLSQQEQGEINGYALSRRELTQILEERLFLEQLRHTLDEALAIAWHRGISKPAIEQVLLVGGSCLLPPVQDLVCAYFGTKRVKVDQPFTAVAKGALALLANSWVSDYLHHSYGIRLWEPYTKQYQFYPLFKKGTKYPTQLATPVILQTANDGQTVIHLDIGEIADTALGEVSYDAQGKMTSTTLLKQSDFHPLTGTAEQLQTLTIPLEPAGQIGRDRLEVYFAIDSDRRLLVTATDLATGQLVLDQHPVTEIR
jgi:molecular chaperone DnaK (HSP70)